ncbi:N-acetylmuramoyl-L-alanine amidase [soil metagenome]
MALAAGLMVSLGAAGSPKPSASPVGLIKVRFGGDQIETRVVMEMSRSSVAKLISEGQPVVLDLPRIDLGAEREGRGQGLVRAWTADGTAGAARIKFELVKPAKISRRFLLAPADGVANYRYVVDLKADGSAAVSAPIKPISAKLSDALDAAAAPPVKTPTVAPVKTAAKAITLKKVIVIDAGHGGHDPGALGENVQEKAVTLAAAKALKKRLESTGRYKVVLTRDSDTFVELDNRVQIARRAGADLFISLHADSGANKATRGASIYTLSDKGSERVQRSFGSELSGLIRASDFTPTPAVSKILLDLTQRATRNRSASFAQGVLDRISDVTPLLERSHRDAAYRVLLAPDVPAVLLEMGFITNPDDEAFLTNASERAHLVDAVGDAIDDYFFQDIKLASR